LLRENALYQININEQPNNSATKAALRHLLKACGIYSGKITNVKTSFQNNFMKIANTPSAPYYAVIFTSLKTENDDGYGKMAEKMEELVVKQDGYLGHESARDGLGITVSYWKDLDAIRNWKKNSEHLLAQKTGREKWYKSYKVRICKVERDYEF
jgi:heme-degrading monooxygenase HmoA